ncbi:30S ribosomal protein S11 [Candidatus Wolfebacteria bacterium]|nr:30S ribosomal protein S11 [Candidatus Wolfebacteria bacterium]
MGKKKVIVKTDAELLGEKEKLEAALVKAGSGDKAAGKKIESGRVYVNASYNNTVITVTDRGGNVLAWASSGSLGFSGPKKATPFAASKVVMAISEKIKKSGVVNVDVIVKGMGSGRDSAVRSLTGQGFNILSIRDVTSIPHNGPKPPKVRRV